MIAKKYIIARKYKGLLNNEANKYVNDYTCTNVLFDNMIFVRK